MYSHPLACNRSAAPHLRAISQAYVHGVRGAWPLARTCGTAERLQPVK
ncbi:MAG TPA: chemotaxis protein CheW, partial [Desulfurivibrio alkaliphilus]|nr:chemotaxis protein CheW [Desulfurivibrio alkaliphilus]